MADDHQIVREGLAKLLATVDGVEPGCSVSDGPALIRALQDCAAGCNLVLLDLSMPGGGLDLIRQVSQLFPDLPMLVLSMHNDSILAGQAMKAGARGYVTKDCDPELLIQAIRTVAAGGQYVDPALIDHIHTGNGQPAHEKLSIREMEVYMLLVTGHSVTAIAQQLAISIKTVSAHKVNLMHKLGIENNADLVRFAISHHLIA